MDPREEGGNSLPTDAATPFDPALYPHDPDVYEPLDHVYQHQKDEKRRLTKPIDGYSAIRKAIIDGDLREASHNRGEFVLPVEGVTYYIIVDIHVDGYPVVVTGYPNLDDAERAAQSRYWTAQEIEMIKRFNEEHRKHNHRWCSKEMLHRGRST
jgi:hypothetical protein